MPSDAIVVSTPEFAPQGSTGASDASGMLSQCEERRKPREDPHARGPRQAPCRGLGSPRPRANRHFERLWYGLFAMQA